MLSKSKGKTLEEIAADYKNKKSEKNKRKLKKYKETQNLQMREPIYWRVGKKLSSSKTEDVQKFTCYYHDRKTPEQHRQDLIQAYAEWNRIYDSGGKRFPNDLIEHLDLLEWVPNDELISIAISKEYRGDLTGHSIDEERARYTYERTFYLQCPWRDYKYSYPYDNPDICFFRLKENLPVPLPCDPPICDVNEEQVDYEVEEEDQSYLTGIKGPEYYESEGDDE